uniref:DDE Tnp4 domain-containing protein n=1 Tax=Sinocyclocheilus anshuiensis TaxID=1608454 RepID=A0A671S3S7_9TELE
TDPQSHVTSHHNQACLTWWARALFGLFKSSFRLGISTVAEIVPETCEAFWSSLKEEHMPVPTEHVWRNTAKRFEERWNFPNCLGAIDGKHIVIQAPGNSGSLYFNYKSTFSVVLLAVVDADYHFLVMDVGSYGSNSDGDIFSNSTLGKGLREGTLNVPPPAELPGAPELGKVNHVIVADEAFLLKLYLLRPYPGRHLPRDMKMFNYRLSRACRILENCFGILSQGFKVFHWHLQASPMVVDSIVKAACILCNYLRPSDQNSQDDLVQDESSNCTAIGLLRHLQGNRATIEAHNLRDIYKLYLNSPAGQVEWQYEQVHGGLGCN